MKFSVGLICLLVAARVQAQTIFYDGFENYPDVNNMYVDGGWNDLLVDRDIGETRPYPVGPSDSVMPRTGSHMLDFRASALGSLRGLEHYVGELTTAPIAECSFWFNFGPSSVEQQKFSALFSFSGRGFNFELNPDHTTINYTGSASGGLPVSIANGSWYKFECRADWLSQNVTFGIRGQSSVTRKILIANSARKVTAMNFSLRPLTATTDKYTVRDGAPGVFIDDFHVVGVPEPHTITGLTASIAAVILRKRSRANRR